MSFKKQMEKWTIELLKSELWVNNRQGSTAGELNLNESQRLHASWKNSISRAYRHYPTPGRQRTIATSSSLPHGWRLTTRRDSTRWFGREGWCGYMSLYLCHHSWRWTSQRKVSRLLYTDFKREEKCEETKSPRVQWKQNRKCLLCGNPRKFFLGMDCPTKGCIILHLKF